MRFAAKAAGGIWLHPAPVHQGKQVHREMPAGQALLPLPGAGVPAAPGQKKEHPHQGGLRRRIKAALLPLPGAVRAAG